MIELKTNYGRAIARNVGLGYARGSIVSFVDSDMILPNDFVSEHFYRAALVENALFTGFYHNISPADYRGVMDMIARNGFGFNGDYRTDFRYQKRFLTADKRKSYNILNKDIGKEYHLLSEYTVGKRSASSFTALLRKRLSQNMR